MIDYAIVLYVGLAFLSFLSGIHFLNKSKEEEDMFAVAGFLQILFSGIFLAISILKTILWIKGL